MAQAQNARSSSIARSRRFPLAGSSTQILVGAPRGDRAGEGLSGDGEAFPGPGCAGGLQERVGGLASLVDGAHQDREDGQPLAGAGVHARLAMPGGLALVDLLLADRAGRDPRCPAGGVLERPLGQVQVERPDRGQALAVADPVHGDGRLARRRRW